MAPMMSFITVSGNFIILIVTSYKKVDLRRKNFLSPRATFRNVLALVSGTLYTEEYVKTYNMHVDL
jgi:hypothetical protein